MRRSATSALAASPTMVGAVTVLIAIVAVFLAYNANNGLPFVPTYRISAQVHDADALVAGNEVRIGGARVGSIESIEPVLNDDGTATARLDLRLDADVEPLPADSKITVRSRSALGLKYLEVRKGTSTEGLEAGSTMPVSAEEPEPVELDQILNTFNEPTRLAIQRNLLEFGNALAGRGPDLNSALGELDPLLRRLQPVARNLASPQTALARFVRALGATAAEVAPVAETQADLFVALDTTFGGLAEVARPFIQETISESPPTLETGIRTLPRISTFLDHSAALFADLEPGAISLGQNAPVIADALEAGVPVLRRSPALNRRIPPAAAALRSLNDDAAARQGIDRLTRTNELLSPTARFLAPVQSVCNYGTLLFRNLASVFSNGDGLGTWQNFILFAGPSPIGPPGAINDLYQPDNEVTPSSAPADGASSVPAGQVDWNYLHYNPYPNTASPGQPRECEAGREPWLQDRQVIGNVPGNQGVITEGK
jgi:virulence factor Mce-like protein